MPVKYGSLPFEEQTAFFRAKLNVPTERFTDVWGDQHDTSFMVAGAMKADLLHDLREAVDAVIADGITLAQFRKDFDRIVAAHGWQYKGSRGWRTRVIYETNLRTSYAAGRYAQLTDPDLLRSRPFWEYRHSDAVTHPRPLHVSWDGLVLRHDHPWWGAHWPPNGWGCQCRVFALSERDLRRRGKSGPDEAPDDGIVEHVDRVTGEVHRVPAGIDPGWDYTPGRSVAETVRAQINAKAGRLPADLQQSLARRLDALPPAPPAPPPRLPPLPTFSTVAGVDEDGLLEALRRMDHARAEVSMLARFLEREPVRTLAVRPVQMAGGQQSSALADEVAGFIGRSPLEAYFAYVDPQWRISNGWSTPAFGTVTLKVRPSARLERLEPRALAETVERAVERARAQRAGWSLRELFDERYAPAQPGLLVTWLHEVAHFVHQAARAPAVPRGLPSLTRYATRDAIEWHAEHVAAWVLNRPALAVWDSAVAAYIEELLERAINARGGRP
jgi:hypothetical protein